MAAEVNLDYLNFVGTPPFVMPIAKEPVTISFAIPKGPTTVPGKSSGSGSGSRSRPISFVTVEQIGSGGWAEKRSIMFDSNTLPRRNHAGRLHRFGHHAIRPDRTAAHAAEPIHRSPSSSPRTCREYSPGSPRARAEITNPDGSSLWPANPLSTGPTPAKGSTSTRSGSMNRHSAIRNAR